jgi:hypothetical protein
VSVSVLQARQKLSSTCGSISQMYSFVEQATEATAAQLESTKLALQQHAAKQPAVAEALLEPGPGQVRRLDGRVALIVRCCACSTAASSLSATRGICLLCCLAAVGHVKTVVCADSCFCMVCCCCCVALRCAD